MKILAAPCMSGDNGLTKIELIPDSALVKDGKPFFIPGLAPDHQWDYWIGVAFRSARLGKGIQPEFASRYVDAATLCVLPRPVRDNGQSPSVLDHCFDGAAIIGSWIPLEQLPADGHWQCECSTGLKTCFTPFDILPEFLSHISLWASLKIGDICITSHAHAASGLTEDTLFEASLSGHECLSFRIK